ncbi:type-F conjugative transfer system pilin assembly protein TrbC (plasmid) [Acinetobacter indicus]|uniref:type-F conjugative transfer system pilin assembly protein TrbC n=1 Tax=Acinetobacter indicus TaxID=756892 RepID=UPI001FA722CE|nr:type-F conjugative transfer system pilin assembly protein TrbC [Acinetobacter indicus]UNW11119.1 type-F conjugative transfer system pilin assembly protein TrbC [Acinetobacter indicus]
MKKIMLSAIGLSLISLVYAENYYFPKEDQIAAQKPIQIDMESKAFQQALEQANKQREIFDQVQIPTHNNFPNVKPEKSPIDVEAIAEKYKKKVTAEKARTDGVIAFASFSMPKESLKKLVKDMEKIGGSVIFVGFKGGTYRSMVENVSKLGLEYGNIQVNPNAFDQYKIKTVPAIVLVKPNAEEKLDLEGCVLPDNYSKVSGDVSLEYALNLMAEKEVSDLKTIAQKYLDQLKEKGHG